MVQAVLGAEGLRAELKYAQTRDEFARALEVGGWDLILSDYALPDFDGLAALAMARERYLDIPFLFISAVMGEGQAIESLKSGATDCVLKNRLDRLGPAVRRAVLESKNRVQRLEAELKLRQSEQMLRQITENVTDLVAVLDLDGRRLYNSPSYKHVLGDPSAPPGSDSFAEIHPEDKERVQRAFTETVQSGRGQRAEFRFLLKDGSVRFIESQGSVVCDAQGQPVNVIVVSRDITGRRQADEQIRVQAALLDKAQDAIAVCDPDGRLVYWNRSAERIYGWPAAEALGRNANEVFRQNPCPTLDEARQLVAERGEWMGELHHRTKTGEELVIQSRWTLVPASAGRPKSLLLINTDITDKKNSETQFLRAQRMESIGTLAGGIAHDLNNMLVPILMASQLLRMKIYDTDGKKWLDTLEASTQRSAGLIRQVLAFARGEEGERAELQMCHLISEIQKILQETFSRAIQIRTNVANNLWTVNGDLTQLQQVLMNLSVNARDAMPAGGVLEIVAENVTVDAATLRLHPVSHPGPYVVITVSDTGSGIPPHILSRIFDPFFTTKESGKGTGLGLTTVQGIMKRHGGSMAVTSEVGKGTRFKAYLPAITTAAPVASRPEQPKPELPWGHGELILLVDDEPAIREIIQATLEKYDYRVLTANDGTEGLSVYMRHGAEIRVIITDMMMPVMDGSALIRALLKVDPTVKFIAISGLVENEKIAEMARPGQIVFLQKPFPTEKLLGTISELLLAHPAARGETP